jgi:hypothetical protein
VHLAHLGASCAPCCSPAPIGFDVEAVHETHTGLGREPEPAGDHPGLVHPVRHRTRPSLLRVQLLAIARPT